MAVAAQLHGSAAAAAAAAYRRLPLYRVPSSCRWPRSPLAALPELSISTGGVGMSPFGVGAKVSTKCANGTTQVDELNLRSNQTEELVEADEDTVTQNRSAKIHDFCLGIPFAEGVYWRVGADIHKVIHMLEKRIGVIQSETKAILSGPKRNIGGLLFCMGLLGYIFSRSTISLVLGVAPGLATLFLGTLSLNFWRSGKSSFMFILGQAAISAVLAWKYSHAYILTNRILPWAFYASLSTAMACFYAYVLLSGGNPPPKKKMAATPSS